MRRIITLQDVREAIQQAVETDGQYSYNICSCVLRLVDERWGRKQATKLIKEFNLTETYGIHALSGKPVR
jgi:hypothetical protein